jgi:PhzF family phenazine biosynthesis protein
MSDRYWVVDAFTDTLFAGNPAAVMLPEAPLPEALMRSIAAENNLSETAFAVREEGGWHLRWFTPTVEVQLCGHATLATSFVLARLGFAGPFHFRTLSGQVTALVEDGRIVLDFPIRARRPEQATAPLVEILGLDPIDVFYAKDIVAVLPSAEAVRALAPDIARIKSQLPGGALVVTAAGAGEADITSRYFAPGYGIDEDPVTGGIHTALVPYWAERLGRAALVCDQASARGGRLWCEDRGDRVRLAGNAVLYAEGTLALNA